MTARSRWLDEGLDVLTETAGLSGLTIEALCERLSLSKGSFYHHFKGMPGYKLALLEHFEERETRAFIDLVDSLPAADGAGKLRPLIRAVVAQGDRLRLETTIRAWGDQDAEVRTFVERIDATRVAFLQRQCRAIVKDRRLAGDVGQMIYLVLIGSNHILPPVSVKDQGRLWGRLVTLLELEAERRSRSA